MAAEKLPTEIVEKLLSQLSSDDGFRERFVASPAAALGELGYAPADKTLSAATCLQVKSLASKDQIKAAHEDLKVTLSARLPKGGFGLEAS